MTVIIRACLRLEPGAKLYYDCPIKGDSFEANRFFDAHRGKEAEFVGYAEELVGPLDHQGRMPGRYFRYDALVVRFEGEEPRTLNAMHFALFNPVGASFAEVTVGNWAGELVHPVLFYPDDLVHAIDPEKRIPDATRRVREVLVGNESFAPGSAPRYFVQETDEEYEARLADLDAKSKDSEIAWMGTLHQRDRTGWNMPADHLTLASRGNCWALYEAPGELSFENDEAELSFWRQDGISKRLSGKEAEATGSMVGVMRYAYGYPLGLAYDLFKSGEADLILRSDLSPPKGEPGYVIRRLHDRFADHRLRVRALTERLWREKAESAVSEPAYSLK